MERHNIDRLAPSATELFTDAVARHAPTLSIRIETPDDLLFILDMAVQCSPLGGILPPEMCLQQAEMQLAAHRAEHPAAIGYIASVNQSPCGRFLIDWTSDGASTYAVDIAVLPPEQRQGFGLAMLSAWTEVADRLAMTAHLQVLANNPARTIYERLGFVLDPGVTIDDPVLFMHRFPAIDTVSPKK